MSQFTKVSCRRGTPPLCISMVAPNEAVATWSNLMTRLLHTAWRMSSCSLHTMQWLPEGSGRHDESPEWIGPARIWGDVTQPLLAIWAGGYTEQSVIVCDQFPYVTGLLGTEWTAIAQWCSMSAQSAWDNSWHYIRTYSSPSAPLGFLSWPLWGIARVLRTHRLTTKCSSTFFMAPYWHPSFIHIAREILNEDLLM